MTEKQLSRLEPVSLRSIWTDEARDFTPWLAQEENLELLSSTLGMELELEASEISVGPYRADILARDVVSDTKVVIENQLEKTDHDHLGKALTYAAGLDARVIIWIAREFTEEHRQAIDFLNQHVAPNLRFFGIVIQLWKIRNSIPAPLFKIVSSPNDYAVITNSSDPVPTGTQGLYLEFWQGFKDYCQSKGTFLRLPKPLPHFWYSLGIGRGNFRLSLEVSIQRQDVNCQIYITGPNARSFFEQLKLNKEEIEMSLGELDWVERPNVRRIIKWRKNIDLRDRATWPSIFSWLKDQREHFFTVFRPRIMNLSLENFNGEDEEGNQEAEDTSASY